VQRIEDFLAAHPFWMTVLIRLLPVGNNFATNPRCRRVARAGAPFFSARCSATFPQTLVFALAGSGVDVGGVWRIGIAVALFPRVRRRSARGSIAIPAWQDARRGSRRALEQPGSQGVQRSG
jgi:hypothetical protein